MKKVDLVNFIEKYHLGIIEPVIWTVANNGCSINFVAEDKTLIGSIVAEKGIDIQDSEFGVYTTSELLKILNIMGDDIEIEIKSIDTRPYNLNIKDKQYKSTYVLAEKAIIPKAGKAKSMPEFNVTYSFDKKFIDDYLKAKNGLGNVDVVAFEAANGEMKVTVGYSTSQTNRVTWKVSADVSSALDTSPFSAEYLKAILAANKDAKSSRLQISAQGLLRIQCVHEKFVVEYFMVRLNIQ